MAKQQRMNPLLIILFRLLRGERLSQRGEERRWDAGFFFLLAVYFGLGALFIRYAKHFLDTAGPFALIVVGTVVGSVLVFGSRLWGRHVPAKVSWTLAAIAWPVLFLLALTGRLV